ncbi:MAG TPA: hypothetical protein VJT73_12720 [Polyangiaceae bacterium]|nr:hypothetical protein [Polyangiaceae bacterium]
MTVLGLPVSRDRRAKCRWTCAVAGALVLAAPVVHAETATPSIGGPGAPPTEVAPESPARGVSVGLRVGYAFPIGSLATNDSLGSNFGGMLPLWLDAGYRVSEQVYLGGYFQYGFAFVSSEVCPTPLGCSASDLRFGVDAHWHFRSLVDPAKALGAFDPWVGLGAGYEIATTRLSLAGTTGHQTNSGFEFGNLQMGGDYLGLGPVRLGGFAALTLARYTQQSNSTPGGSLDSAIREPANHLWFMLGVRSQYDF